MIIRSQDKTMLMPFENSNGVYIVRKEVHICGDIYGEYSTREKAIKVLDMIQDAYARCESTKTLSSGTMVDLAGKFNQKQSDDFISEHRTTFVFQMPQDSEV